ncbi:hypothetical protein P8452_18516 [Trifolium repens]|nr:hypothetical protein P8452_18516 [Trifolium repens]
MPVGGGCQKLFGREQTAEGCACAVSSNLQNVQSPSSAVCAPRLLARLLHCNNIQCIKENIIYKNKISLVLSNR